MNQHNLSLGSYNMLTTKAMTLISGEKSRMMVSEILFLISTKICRRDSRKTADGLLKRFFYQKVSFALRGRERGKRPLMCCHYST